MLMVIIGTIAARAYKRCQVLRLHKPKCNIINITYAALKYYYKTIICKVIIKRISEMYNTKNDCNAKANVGTATTWQHCMTMKMADDAKLELPEKWR